MKTALTLFIILINAIGSFAQKDSLNLGDRYAEDQIYVAVSYAQFVDQPQEIFKSNFSYGLSVGFLKDVILNKQGNVSIAVGVGYGFDFFNHELKVEEINNTTVFSSDATISANLFKSHNLEFPLEFRWRTSTANKYSFWRIYGGIKFSYNFSNKFQFDDENGNTFKYQDVSNYNKLQYGLTLSTGYDEFNINLYYGLTPVFENSTINGEVINTKILKFGLIFYLL
ncbi:porin family protein [Polaribacter undariae]|uniref:Porin family protein n=1 Tax=Polaribacter sejongensis TaxID=985043 RepID=A0AAJ1QV20_9FLAO|nr:porin family protein [Polaribacter undariae]MDN3618572.1 porin family protein [Polaribacter undariae]UWD30447.1 PorT family protein [Polaribacter undariae]